MTRKQQIRRRYPFAFNKNQTIRAFNRCQIGGGAGIRNMPEKNISAIPKKAKNPCWTKLTV
jgi:hypothetical protein